MPRFNALTSTLEIPIERPKSRRKPSIAAPVPKAPKAPPAKAPPIDTELSRHACRVPVATFAALLRIDDKRVAETHRAAFAAWCASRPELPLDWRAAWAAYHQPAPAAPRALSSAREYLASLHGKSIP